MRLLHISDLHIGRRLYGYSLLDDQRHTLGELAALARECDAVLIAGDIYDRFTPSAETVRLASDFFVALGGTGKPVFAISGNHDSAEQVAYCRELLASGGVYVAPAFGGALVRHTLRDEYGEVDIVLMPFLKPSTVRPYSADAATCEDAARFVLSTAPLDPTRRSVLVAHQFVTGAEVCESETLSLGGLDRLGASVFDGFDYAALGHLHSPQSLMGGRVRYCGSPLKYSLSEVRQKKSATIVTLREKGSVEIEARPITPLRETRIARGALRELCAPERHSDDYVFAVLTDEAAPLDPIGSLRVNYPNLLGMKLESREYASGEVYAEADEAEGKSPLDHFMDFYAAQHGGREPDEARVKLMKSVLEKAEVSARETDKA